MVVRIERWEQFRNKRVRKRVRVRENTGVGFTVFLLFVDWYWRVSRRGGYEVDFERRVGERIRTFFLRLVFGFRITLRRRRCWMVDVCEHGVRV